MELGRLTQDVVLETVSGGKKVLNNCVAIRLNKTTTTFLDVTAWDDTAELIATYFRKGYEILFSGRLVNKRKFAKKGVEVQTVCAVIDRVHFFNGNPREGTDAHAEDDFLKQFENAPLGVVWSLVFSLLGGNSWVRLFISDGLRFFLFVALVFFHCKLLRFLGFGTVFESIYLDLYILLQ